MPRLGVSISRTYVAHPYGRSVRRIDAFVGANRDRRSILFHPAFVKLAAGLAVVAATAVVLALRRVLHFPH